MKTKTDALFLIRRTIAERHGIGDQAADDIRVRSYPTVFKGDDADPLRFTATITANVLDRDNEVVVPDGGDFSEFSKSGAIFWNHNYDMPVAFPQGKIAKSADGLHSSAKFMERPADYQGEFFPDFARAFVNQGAAAGQSVGVSIGFIPTKMREPSSKEKDQYGSRITNIISRWKLLEWSIAPVQSNPSAVVTAVGKGQMLPEVASKMFGVDVGTDDSRDDGHDNGQEIKAPERRTIIVIDPRPEIKKPAHRRKTTKDVLTLAIRRRRGELYE